MPAVNLSPIFNGQQFFTTAGIPLSGGLINSYLAGSATPVTTYADSGGGTPNSNPIQLDTAGFMPAELWLVNAVAHKFVVTDSLGANARTYDNITAPLPATATGTNFTTTSNTVGFTAKLSAIGGVTGFEWQDQAAARKADHLFWGASSSPLYGMTAGWAGVNTAAGVGYTIGTNDLVRVSVDPTTGVSTFNPGLSLPNVAYAPGTVLDWYEEGIFSPTIAFGGASVGVTYSINRMGRFTRIGNRVFFNLRLLLTSKGSSVGTARIGGLPYAADGNPGADGQVCSMDFNGMSGLTGVPFGVIVDTATGASIFQTGAAASAAVTDAAFTNSSDVYLSGQYKV